MGAYSNPSTFTASSTDTLTNKTIAGGSNTISGITQSMLALSVSTQTNAGTAGGTMNYINLGGIKMLWGTSATLTGSSLTNGSNWTITFPTSFFTTAIPVSATWDNLVGVAQQALNWNPIAATGGTITQGTVSTPTGNQVFSYMVIGT